MKIAWEIHLAWGFYIDTAKAAVGNLFLVSCNLQLVCGTKTLQGVKLLSLLLELDHGK